MATMKYELYKITAMTNMHVGSGDMNFGVIDKLVQRDSLTGYPVIYSSSLKGALREFFKNETSENERFLNYVFGAPPVTSKGETTLQSNSGEYKFFSANLLSIPVRSNTKPFYRAISPFIVKEFIEALERFKIENGIEHELKSMLDNIGKRQAVKNGAPCIFENREEDVILEDLNAAFSGIDVSEGIKGVFGDDLAVFHDDDFKEICKDLPIIARNNLENGISRNLWYEEIVPRQTRFYFIVAVPESDKTKDIDEKFEKFIQTNLVQIGANASIGYGFTAIDKVNKRG